MLSSNAVRHRGGNNSPDNNPSKALTIKSDSGDSVASANGKLHGRFKRGSSNKVLLVAAGAACVLAMCLAGMWVSSASVDGGRAARQMDRRHESAAVARPNHHKKGKKKRPALQRPRGIGRRKEEEFFLIPEETIHEPAARLVVVDEQHGEEEGGEVRDRRGKDPRRSPLHTARKVESEGSDEGKRHKKAVNVDDREGPDSSDHDKDDEDDGRIELSADEKELQDVDEEGRTEQSDDKKEEASGLMPVIKKAGARESGYQILPRVLRLQFEEVSGNERRSGDEDKDTREDGPKFNFKNVVLASVHRLPAHESEDLASSERYISPYPDDDEYHERLAKIKMSKKYRKTEREPLEDKECKPRHEWQKGALPNCNVLHEFELGQLSGMFGRAVRKGLRKQEGDGDELVKYLAHGYWRDVWLMSKASRSYDPLADDDGEEMAVLKTLRYKHDFTDRNYDRHRKDALASERLSGSDHVVDIFAYCSNSAVFEYGPGGDIEGKLWPYDEEEEKYYVADIPSHEKLEMAYQVAVAIAETHEVEGDGYASIAHTDITPSQFILINNQWKLNDFNRCRFMRVYKEDNSPCGFYVGANPGKFRAPEEYEFKEENEMIDVYSMGNIFYAILAGEMPFEGQKESKAQKKVIGGRRPGFPKEILSSEDAATQAMLAATKKCWAHAPGDRPKAASIRNELKEAMDRIKKENATGKS
mmetsp:Transcript_2157/g.4711  ORF Transcript_2157/g.4711 Transcript_2157/m.4711 type:complete len:702 (+) Transcript_2157:191-2296(+)